VICRGRYIWQIKKLHAKYGAGLPFQHSCTES
jgi:hypothetical protein